MATTVVLADMNAMATAGIIRRPEPNVSLAAIGMATASSPVSPTTLCTIL